MNYRKAVLLDNETASTAGTKEIDLKGLDPMTRLVIMMSGVNNGNTPTAHPAKMVSSIQLVDGSDVLWSLSGIEAQALAFAQEEKLPSNIVTYVDDNYCRALFPINFGRWLWDEDLAFDPSRFKNPKLKITHNKASGGSAPDAGYLSVYAEMFDERKVVPQGYIMAKEHFSYSLASSAKEVVDLPTDYPLKSLTIQSLSDGKTPNEQINKIKLHENNGKKVVIEDGISNLQKYLNIDKEPARERIRANITTGSLEVFCMPTYETAVVGGPADGAASYPKVTYGEGGTFDVVGAASGMVDFLLEGFSPHGAVNIPFADPWEAALYYDISKLAKLTLELTAGSSVGSSSTAQVVLEQLRRY